ncbi:uncharacterized protein [Bactrocera oleae]|uniref:uncharacterized protein isoform X2 n=1 Tax=Bactrocera oleae TaxID=104688 RepID=UPI00174D2C68|nr:uncharacterized protein LOC106616181 isoform X2 [Bactrocera oleae]XP_036213508.1 uncharacterized protein LOC106616181 isoform X2 [Bactrocera oleae]
MQSAADCNGTKSNKNGATTTTIMQNDITSASSCDELLPHDVTSPGSFTPTVLLTPVAMLEQTSVLRHRLQVGVGVGHSIGTSAMNYGCPATVATTTHRVESFTPHPIDMVEYLGSNTERMSVTPSPSPQVSPSKTIEKNSVVISAKSMSNTTPNTEFKLASGQSNISSSSSSSNSSSNSTISSVIATPISIKREMARRRTLVVESCVDGIDIDTGATFSTSGDILTLNGKERVEQRDVLPFRGLPLRTANEENLGLYTQTTPSTPRSSLSSPSSLSSSTNLLASSTNLESTSIVQSPKSSIELKSRATTKSPSFNSTKQLQKWQDMPKYLQFNPYVLNGYRPLTTFRGCLWSLFCWHNETVNILTHAIPIFYILAIVPGLMPWEQEYRFLSFCHIFGSVAPWCGSFIYHLFMNIESGENVYYTLLKLDMVGIWVSQSFGALPLVTATTFCFSPFLKWFIILSYCLLSLWGLYKALTASSPWQRRLCFALPFTMRSILTLFRTMDVWVGGSRIALSHVYLQDGVSILGGAIGALRIPEKWFPGVVDFYLNSHNIMHVLVVVAVYSMHKATIKDFEWMSATNCNAPANNTAILMDTFTSNVEL